MSENPILKQRADVNPYRYAAALLWSRLKWDFLPESWISRSRLRRWRNRFLGEKAVILCNGPSLLKSDLSLLDGVFTFGLNKINLLFESNSFRPSCIVSVNDFVISQNSEYFNTTDIPLFLSCRARRLVGLRGNVIFIHSASQNKIARDCSISVVEGNTVTVVALQLALHMGFKSVALIGCDHYFTTNGPANKVDIATGKDTSHFHPSYFSGGQKWELPDLASSEYFYSMARSTFEADGREIVNCTEGGNLEIFERKSLQDWLA
jgi:hypothetical protein